MSRRLLLFVLVGHAAAVFVLLPLPLHWGGKLALCVLILASLGYTLWARILNLAPWSIVETTWTDIGWHLTTAAGRTFDARLCSSTYVGVDLVILNLRVGRLARRSLVLTVDNVDPDRLRRLRARLRLSGSAHA